MEVGASPFFRATTAAQTLRSPRWSSASASPPSTSARSVKADGFSNLEDRSWRSTSSSTDLQRVDDTEAQILPRPFALALYLSSIEKQIASSRSRPIAAADNGPEAPLGIHGCPVAPL